MIELFDSENTLVDDFEDAEFGNAYSQLEEGGRISCSGAGPVIVPEELTGIEHTIIEGDGTTELQGDVEAFRINYHPRNGQIFRDFIAQKFILLDAEDEGIDVSCRLERLQLAFDEDVIIFSGATYHTGGGVWDIEDCTFAATDESGGGNDCLALLAGRYIANIRRCNVSVLGNGISGFLNAAGIETGGLVKANVYDSLVTVTPPSNPGANHPAIGLHAVNNSRIYARNTTVVVNGGFANAFAVGADGRIQGSPGGDAKVQLVGCTLDRTKVFERDGGNVVFGSGRGRIASYRNPLSLSRTP